MKKHDARKGLLAAVGCALLVGCAAQAQMEGPANAFRMSSPGKPDNARFDPKGAGNFAKNPNCTGQNVSPPLAWSSAPAKTRSYALIVDDQAGRNGLGVSHGVVYGIAGNAASLPEGALGGAPGGRFVGGSNSLGLPYLGPCPPRGLSAHHYVFTLIATDLEPDALRAGLKRDELLKALNGHALGAASLVLRFNQ